ncbi:hypothetical protein ACUWCL_28380, partial [Klebsiella pneumoniae]|uniref:hypothetical protein n=1 Tax=Klebsiella pneumoniae TaxID=573 RepID=UPI00405542F5
RRPRSIAATSRVPKKYYKPVPINDKKKKDLISLLPLIPKEFHQFYKTLPTNSQAKEFDEVESDDD